MGLQRWEPRVLIMRVTAAGTPEAGAFSGNSTLSPKVIIAALADNTDNVYYGGTDISATTRKTLIATQADEFTAPAGDLFNLSKMRFDAAVSNEGFEITYFVPSN